MKEKCNSEGNDVITDKYNKLNFIGLISTRAANEKDVRLKKGPQVVTLSSIYFVMLSCIVYIQWLCHGFLIMRLLAVSVIPSSIYLMGFSLEPETNQAVYIWAVCLDLMMTQRCLVVIYSC